MNEVSFQPDKMYHATHFGAARQIVEEGMTFRTAMKMARDDYSYEYAGEGKDGPVFEQLSGNRAMLPGYYSWFAAKPPDGLGALAIKQLREQYGDIDAVLSDKLKTDSSPYGTVGLATSMDTLLESYKAGFPNSANLNLRFQIGGTLRYFNEICYVIVVTVDDTVWTNVPTIVRPEEEIIQLPFIRLARSKSNAMWCSWEQTVFAFHYPHPNQALQLPPSKVDILPVKHHCFDQQLQVVKSKYEPPRCHAANFRRDGKCPDAVDFKRKKRIPFDELLQIKRNIEELNVDEYHKQVLEKIAIEEATKNIDIK